MYTFFRTHSICSLGSPLLMQIRVSSCFVNTLIQTVVNWNSAGCLKQHAKYIHGEISRSNLCFCNYGSNTFTQI